jgi:short-subunit dehydrogenase
MDVAGKVVVITGASRGIGADLARGFAQAGARLALSARSETQLREVADGVRAMGAEAVVAPVDVEDRSSLQAMVDQVNRELGPIDVLINNAGVDKIWDFADLPVEDIEWIVRVNLIGLMTATRLVVPQMLERRSGHVVNMASAAGLAPVPFGSVYSASKHGVVGFSRSLRIELAPHGIGVSVVCPGYVLGDGMFAQHGLAPPKRAGSVTVADVTQAVLTAVRRNRAEVVPAPVSNRLAKVVVSISPRAYAAGMTRTGVFDFLREYARRNQEREGRSGPTA